MFLYLLMMRLKKWPGSWVALHTDHSNLPCIIIACITACCSLGKSNISQNIAQLQCILCLISLLRYITWCTCTCRIFFLFFLLIFFFSQALNLMCVSVCVCVVNDHPGVRKASAMKWLHCQALVTTRQRTNWTPLVRTKAMKKQKECSHSQGFLKVKHLHQSCACILVHFSWHWNDPSQLCYTVWPNSWKEEEKKGWVGGGKRWWALPFHFVCAAHKFLYQQIEKLLSNVPRSWMNRWGVCCQMLCIGIGCLVPNNVLDTVFSQGHCWLQQNVALSLQTLGQKPSVATVRVWLCLMHTSIHPHMHLYNFCVF